MSDVITKVGDYMHRHGSEALKCRIVHVEDGYAFGFDSDGDPDTWRCSDGCSAQTRDITGPWIPYQPEPPAGFVVMPKEYVAKEGDVLWDDDYKHWVPATGAIGYSTDQMNSRWSDPPYYVASPIPKPFSISEHGIGVYETRDGEEATVKHQCSVAATYIWKGCTQSISYASWSDSGKFEVSMTLPHDLVRYLRPLPKPAIDPGEVVPQPEWTPTNELRLAKTAFDDPLGTWYGKGADSQWLRIEQRWTNGTDSEWRPVKVNG